MNHNNAPHSSSDSVRPQNPSQQAEVARARVGGTLRGKFLALMASVGALATAAGVVAVNADAKDGKSENGAATAPEHLGDPHLTPVQEKLSEELFAKRHGEEMRAAIEADHGNGDKHFQEFVDEAALKEGEGLTKRDEIIVRCMEDRLLICGCGIGGSGILTAAADGKTPRVPEPEEMAARIFNYVMRQEGDKNIVIVEHEDCGANRIAYGLSQGISGEELAKTPKSIIDDYGKERGGRVVEELRTLMERAGKTGKVRMEEATFEEKEMVGEPGTHPGKSMWITAMRKYYLDPNSKKLPQGMLFDPQLLAENNGDFELHLLTGIKILMGDHGAHPSFLPICILADTPEEAQAWKQRAEGVVSTFPEEIRSKIRVSAAVVGEQKQENEKVEQKQSWLPPAPKPVNIPASK